MAESIWRLQLRMYSVKFYNLNHDLHVHCGVIDRCTCAETRESVIDDKGLFNRKICQMKNKLTGSSTGSVCFCLVRYNTDVSHWILNYQNTDRAPCTLLGVILWAESESMRLLNLRLNKE